MEELKIYKYQAKQIEDTLRMVANRLKSHSKETCLDRNVIQSWEMIQNVLSGDIDKLTSPHLTDEYKEKHNSIYLKEKNEP